MAGYKIKDKQIAQTLVKAGREKPWQSQCFSIKTENSSGIFIKSKLGIVKEKILPCAVGEGGIVPSVGKVCVGKQKVGEGDERGVIEKYANLEGLETEETVYNFTEWEFAAGEVVMVVSDVFNKYYVLPAKSPNYGILRTAMGHFEKQTEGASYVVECQGDGESVREIEVSPIGMVGNSPGFEWNLPAGTPVRVESGKIVEAFLPELWGSVKINGGIEDKGYDVTLGKGMFHGSEIVTAWPSPNIPQDVEFEGVTPVVVRWNHAAGKWFFFVIRKGGTVSEWTFFEKAIGTRRKGFRAYLPGNTSIAGLLFIRNAVDDVLERTYTDIFAKKERVDVLPAIYKSNQGNGLTFFYYFPDKEVLLGDGKFYLYDSYKFLCQRHVPDFLINVTCTDGSTVSLPGSPAERFPDMDYPWHVGANYSNSLQFHPLYGWYYGSVIPNHTEYSWNEEEGLVKENVVPDRLLVAIEARGYNAPVISVTGQGKYENCTSEVIFTWFRSEQRGDGWYPEVEGYSSEYVPETGFGSMQFSVTKGNTIRYVSPKLHPQSDFPSDVYPYDGLCYMFGQIYDFYPFFRSPYVNCLVYKDSKFWLGRKDSEWGGYYVQNNNETTAVWETYGSKDASSRMGLPTVSLTTFREGKVVLSWVPTNKPSTKSVRCYTVLKNTLEKGNTSKSIAMRTYTAYKGLESDKAATEAKRTLQTDGTLKLVNDSTHPQRQGSDLYNAEKCHWIGLDHVDSCPEKPPLLSTYTTAKYPHWWELSGETEVVLKYTFITYSDLKLKDKTLAYFVLNQLSGCRLYLQKYLIADCAIHNNAVYFGWDVENILQQSITMTSSQTNVTREFTWAYVMNNPTGFQVADGYLTYTENGITWRKVFYLDYVGTAPYTLLEEPKENIMWSIKDILNNVYPNPIGFCSYQLQDERCRIYSLAGSISDDNGRIITSIGAKNNVYFAIDDVPEISWWEWDVDTSKTIDLTACSYDAEKIEVKFDGFSMTPCEQADLWVGAANVWDGVE